MEDWARLSDSSENEDGFDSTASSDIHNGDKPRADSRCRVGQKHSDKGQTLFDTGRTSSRTSLVLVSSNVSTHSAGSDVLFCPSSTYSLLSSTPNFSAPEARDRPHDAILQSFASRTPPYTPAATSPPRRISKPSSISPTSVSSHSSSDTDESTSCSDESRPEQQSWVTPASSAPSSVDDNVSMNLDQEVAHRIQIFTAESVLHDLSLQNDPLPLSSANSDFTDVLEEIESRKLEDCLHSYGTPWAAGAHHDRWSAELGSTLGFPKTADTGYYWRAKVHKQIQRRVKQERPKAAARNNQAGSSIDGEEAYDELLDSDPIDSRYVVAQSPTAEYSRNRRTSECHDSEAEILRWNSQTCELCAVVDCTSFSVETLSSVFYPAFAFKHLGDDSLRTFSSELIAPNGLLHHAEYKVSISIGFGPSMDYYVCTFIPNNREALRSYRKLPGAETLQAEESLPLIIDLFSPHREADDVDAWLNNVIDSDDHLQAYVDFMQRKKKGSPSVQILMCLVSWYLSSKDNPLKEADDISRAALKLLMTTTLLTLVPKIDDIPPSLHQDLSPRPAPNNLRLSPIAPKLLTRQIKVSIHHLQRQLLHALLFHYLSRELELATEVRVAIALLIAFVLELAGKAGREFAKFASKINHTVQVKEEDVVNYEENVKTQVFNRVRKSVCGSVGRLGQLGNKLKGLGSIAKGKGADTSNVECQYVQSILDTVL